MHNISSYFKLGLSQDKLEFVDVKLDDDNMLFLDPRLLEHSANPHFAPMKTILKSYVSELVKAIITKSHKRSAYLLSGLEEPKETRLGFAKGNSDGNSIGPKLKPKFEDAIRNSPAISKGRVTYWSDLELFIEDINCDRISDMTTKIIKHFLIDFTQQQCRKHGIPMMSVYQKDILDPTSLIWSKGMVDLPVYNDGNSDKPIIFIPKSFVRRKGDANSNIGYFLRYAIDRFIMKDPTALSEFPHNGKNNTVLKKDIKKSIDGRKAALSRWIVEYETLLVDYRSSQLEQRLRSLSDKEIEAVVYAFPNAA